MEQLFEVLFVNLGAHAEVLYDKLVSFTVDKFRALIRQLWKLFAWSLIVLVTALTVSAFPKGRLIMPFIALGYLVIIGWVGFAGRTLRAAGFLLEVDVALDVVKGVLVGAHHNADHAETLRARLGKLASLNLDWERLREFATLQLVGRFVFNALLIEFFLILAFAIIPVWAHPELLGWILALTAGVLLLSTPWGRGSYLSAFRPFALIALVILLIYTSWQEMTGWWQIGQSYLPAFGTRNGAALGLILIVLLVLVMRARKASGTTSSSGGNHGR